MPAGFRTRRRCAPWQGAHNNGSELELRREAVGRKNWLFVGSDEGAEWNTIAV
ncbi:transposase, partial [Polyangium sp. 15x6]|uniref:IS66 family transposase n=1 Tax=Polyangium sp. 15x6 TaxID=3042687 RepID=UPI00249CB463